MHNLYYVKMYFIALITFLGIDAVWLTLVAPSFYKSNIGHLLAEKPNLFPAVIFYLLNTIGIIIFAVNPGLNSNSPKTAAVYGALYGLLTYATYDLTNAATLKDWPIKVVFVDMIWGMLITAAVSFVTFYLVSKIS